MSEPGKRPESDGLEAEIRARQERLQVWLRLATEMQGACRKRFAGVKWLDDKTSEDRLELLELWTSLLALGTQVADWVGLPHAAKAATHPSAGSQDVPAAEMHVHVSVTDLERCRRHETALARADEVMECLDGIVGWIGYTPTTPEGPARAQELRRGLEGAMEAYHEARGD